MTAPTKNNQIIAILIALCILILAAISFYYNHGHSLFKDDAKINTNNPPTEKPHQYEDNQFKANDKIEQKIVRKDTSTEVHQKLFGISIFSKPTNSKIIYNNTIIGHTDSDLKLPFGKQKLIIRHANYFDDTVFVNIPKQNLITTKLKKK